MSKRPHSALHSTSSSDVSDVPNPTRHKRALSHLNVHIIHAKLTPVEIDALYNLAESLGANSHVSIDAADVIITRIRVAKRLERHIDLKVAVSLGLRPCGYQLNYCCSGGRSSLTQIGSEHAPKLTTVCHLSLIRLLLSPGSLRSRRASPLRQNLRKMNKIHPSIQRSLRSRQLKTLPFRTKLDYRPTDYPLSFVLINH